MQSNKVIAITPPLVDEFYRLGRVPNDKKEPVYLIGMNEDLASLMVEAEKFIRTHGERSRKTAMKDAQWRGDSPTPGQIELLNRLDVSYTASITKGGASELITHAIYVNRAASEAWNV